MLVGHRLTVCKSAGAPSASTPYLNRRSRHGQVAAALSLFSRPIRVANRSTVGGSKGRLSRTLLCHRQESRQRRLIDAALGFSAETLDHAAPATTV
jgi:hypothetical protein